PEPVEVAEPAPAPVSDNSEVVELIRGLQDQIDRLSEAPAEDTDGEPVVDTQALDRMRGELDQLRNEAQSSEQELSDQLNSRNLEIAELKNDLDMLRLQNGQSVMPGGSDDLLTQRRQAADEAAQLEQARL
ncbi:hypothetical protein OEZ78_28185, partial [Leclercia adecarboxylata]|uniref:hypothetical protein n=1 Tax=Leclercia adecarboxylata TaxID=83655 RepID=UPI00234C2379